MPLVNLMSFVTCSSLSFACSFAQVSLKHDKLLFDTVKHIIVMMASDVAHDGMASVSHDRVANTKIAITRCWMIVSPSIPNESRGRHHITAVTNKITANSSIFFFE